jgi:site-specific DNA-methyltransferase (adenine-specific)
MEINKIYNESCLNTIKKMPTNFIDLIVTSPPYDNLRDYKGYKFNFKNIANELYRVVKPGGVIVWIVSDQIIEGSKSGTSFKQALYFKKCGFNIHDTIIWSKDTFSYPDSNRYRNTFEFMFILSKGKPKTYNPIKDRKNKYAGHKVHGTSRLANGNTFKKLNDKKTLVADYGVRFNVWNISTEKNSKKYGHPAMFPMQIALDHILSWSNVNDLIYDPFMGSGTTALASLKLNRNYIGSEISKEYCKIIEKRINLYNSQLKLF